MCQDIILSVDYHDRQCVIRRYDSLTETEQVLSVPTTRKALRSVLSGAVQETTPRGARVVWVQESTTGWARMQQLVAPQAKFLLANMLQMPLPPKARRRKTDKIDTSRLQREWLNGTLPLAYQPEREWRQLRRLVALREDLVRRRTALTNWIDRYLAHETWFTRDRLLGTAAQQRLEKLPLPALDRRVLDCKLAELQLLQTHLKQVELALEEIHRTCPAAQRLDAIRGIGPVSAVSILARIGEIQRFRNAEQLIAFAGLAPGVRQSDQTSRGGRLGGPGTDRHLRHYLIEATLWARQIPRYRETYERALRKRGKKIARLVVARLLLRSIYKMLRDQIPFAPEAA